MTTWQRDNITLIHGDCMDYLATLPDGAFSLAVVDPDFGLNEKISNGGTWASKWKIGDGNLGGKPSSAYWRLLFRGTRNQIVWGGNYFKLPPSRGFVIWDKIAQLDTLADCEMAWTSFDRNAKIFRHVRNTPEKRNHITQKPVALYRWLLQNYAKPGDTILDTHLGSGSSAIAAWEMGYTFTGIEIDKDYFDAAVARLEKRMLSPYLPGIVLPAAKQEALL